MCIYIYTYIYMFITTYDWQVVYICLICLFEETKKLDYDKVDIWYITVQWIFNKYTRDIYLNKWQGKNNCLTQDCDTFICPSLLALAREPILKNCRSTLVLKRLKEKERDR